MVIPGIYKIEGDRRSSCVTKNGAGRRLTFDAKEGSGQTLRVFERVTKVRPGKIGDIVHANKHDRNRTECCDS